MTLYHAESPVARKHLVEKGHHAAFYVSKKYRIFAVPDICGFDFAG